MKAPKLCLTIASLACLFVILLAGCSNSKHKMPTATEARLPGAMPETPPFAVVSETQLTGGVQFVPTLDSENLPGVNIIWCASFELAWRQLIDEVLKEPVMLDPPSPVADRLNASKISSKQIPEGNWFAVAGYGDEGIVKRIQEGMMQFPDASYPDFKEYSEKGLLAFAYLTGDVIFETPYLEKPSGLTFPSPDGSKQPVEGFGVLRDDFGKVYERDQVEVLYSSTSGDSHPEEFALDLSKRTEPTQLVVACVKPEATLAGTLEVLDAKIKSWRTEKEERKLQAVDDLLLPTLGFSLLHSYEELLGHALANQVKGQGLPLLRAEQKVDFRLTRWGAQLSSYAVSGFMSASRDYGRKFHFDRPFLVYMKKRGEKTPYFAMWVADATFMYQGSNTSQAP